MPLSKRVYNLTGKDTMLVSRRVDHLTGKKTIQVSRKVDNLTEKETILVCKRVENLTGKETILVSKRVDNLTGKKTMLVTSIVSFPAKFSTLTDPVSFAESTLNSPSTTSSDFYRFYSHFVGRFREPAEKQSNSLIYRQRFPWQHDRKYVCISLFSWKNVV